MPHGESMSQPLTHPQQGIPPSQLPHEQQQQQQQNQMQQEPVAYEHDHPLQYPQEYSTVVGEQDQSQYQQPQHVYQQEMQSQQQQQQQQQQHEGEQPPQLSQHPYDASAELASTTQADQAQQSQPYHQQQLLPPSDLPEPSKEVSSEEADGGDFIMPAIAFGGGLNIPQIPQTSTPTQGLAPEVGFPAKPATQEGGDEDLGFGNSSLSKNKPKTNGEAEGHAKPKGKNPESMDKHHGDGNEDGNTGSGVFGIIKSLWGRDKKQANLGEESQFVYDAKSKRWVNKATGEPPKSETPPPPPPPTSNARQITEPPQQKPSPTQDVRNPSVPPPMSSTATPIRPTSSVPHYGGNIRSPPSLTSQNSA
ncbi:hypothetical protein EV182_005558, partial [Spiromyces aspiralis]